MNSENEVKKELDIDTAINLIMIELANITDISEEEKKEIMVKKLKELLKIYKVSSMDKIEQKLKALNQLFKKDFWKEEKNKVISKANVLKKKLETYRIERLSKKKDKLEKRILSLKQ